MLPVSMRMAKPKIMHMGCYGIGVTRIVAAAIEQNHDDKGHHVARSYRTIRNLYRADRPTEI